MASKKKAARGNTYVLTAAGKKALKEMGPSQGRQVLEAVGAIKNPTQADVLARVYKKLHAPNPAKTVGFHLSVMKNDLKLIAFGPKRKA